MIGFCYCAACGDYLARSWLSPLGICLVCLEPGIQEIIPLLGCPSFWRGNSLHRRLPPYRVQSPPGITSSFLYSGRHWACTRSCCTTSTSFCPSSCPYLPLPCFFYDDPLLPIFRLFSSLFLFPFNSLSPLSLSPLSLSKLSILPPTLLGLASRAFLFHVGDDGGAGCGAVGELVEFQG